LSPDKKFIIPLVHFLTWICIFLYPFLFHYVPFNDVHSVYRIGLFTLLLVMLFYANTHLLIPKILARKKVLVYLASVILLIGFISVCAGYIQMFLNPEYEKKNSLFRGAVNTGIITGVLTWMVSSSIKVTAEWFRNQNLKTQLENENLQTELNFLRSQVNPHFLFNALNNIYSLQNKNSPQTGSAILKLSELTRYMLYETSTNYVPLEKEIHYLKGYVELQQLGLGTGISVNFTTEGRLEGEQIEPMLLIPLVENVFKHGISYNSPCTLSIQIKLKDKTLELFTTNPDHSKNKEGGNGIGLNNLKKRLALLYGDKHTLSIKKINNEFITHLSLTLK
jgi:two-component system, LytTR family, sensor kinase